MKLALSAAALLLLVGPACAQPGGEAAEEASAASAPRAAGGPNYAQDANWLCRPGRRDVCSEARLDAVAIAPDGTRAPRPFQRAADPPVDCFYVYPTISADRSPLSDMSAGPEEARIATSQAARFAARCRVFAPVYRQITLAGLNAAFTTRREPDWATPFGDVRAAWRDYLRRDNGGRGVVIIGHSQGALLLARLLAEEIEPNPDQKARLVSAILAGHTGVGVPEGRDVGGDLKTTPLCRAPGQVGCAVVFASYAAEDPSPRRFFGTVSASGRTAACVNPAAPAGGVGPLKAYLPRSPLAPADDPPFTEVLGQLSAECATDAAGSVLRVRVSPGANQGRLRAVLAGSVVLPAWGLHILDMNLTQGNLLDMVEAQSRTWATRKAGVRP